MAKRVVDRSIRHPAGARLPPKIWWGGAFQIGQGGAWCWKRNSPSARSSMASRQGSHLGGGEVYGYSLDAVEMKVHKASIAGFQSGFGADQAFADFAHGGVDKTGSRPSLGGDLISPGARLRRRPNNSAPRGTGLAQDQGAAPLRQPRSRRLCSTLSRRPAGRRAWRASDQIP